MRVLTFIFFLSVIVFCLLALGCEYFGHTHRRSDTVKSDSSKVVSDSSVFVRDTLAKDSLVVKERVNNVSYSVEKSVK